MTHDRHSRQGNDLFKRSRWIRLPSEMVDTAAAAGLHSARRRVRRNWCQPAGTALASRLRGPP